MQRSWEYTAGSIVSRVPAQAASAVISGEHAGVQTQVRVSISLEIAVDSVLVKVVMWKTKAPFPN